MCPGPKPLPITITVSATTALPWPPGLSDGLTSVPIGGANDADFTTEVVPGQQVIFVTAGDIIAITQITESAGDLFSINPTPENNFTGTIGPKKAILNSEYTLYYTVKGHEGTVYEQDPKLNMKV
tara:strand:+ start:47867 stop:48241 length:375 start_codon:yes stop_codon:yes gene_type:complete